MSEHIEVEDNEEVVENPEKKSTVSYFQYFIDSLKKPDNILGNEEKGLQTYGLINLGVLIGLIILSNFFYRIKLFSSVSWLDVGFTTSLTIGIAYAIPIGAILYIMSWYANNHGNKLNISYFFEKLGAAMSLPIALMIISIPITLITINPGTWIRSLGITFIYIAVFWISYKFASKDNIKVATIFFAGFYLTYRIINFIF
ncbi:MULTISPECIES: hypothetical protein [Bacillaceae]|uniref:Yip1 domain-containing protein n=1 Tax=Evansella alkalicola TaxID=745819 RepID=A0ABS6JYB5_9BACI|nr:MULTISPECIES: hypothetical protein [Bacillaceae]MBU9723593.1 hypothetical protein [Bacillus alkalicola]